MKLILQSNPWECLPTAFAMVLGCQPKEIFTYLMHHGAIVRWPELPEPMCRQGFTVEECIDYAINCDCMYPIIFNSELAYDDAREASFKPLDAEARMRSYMAAVDGVLLCAPRTKPHGHAVAWCYQERRVYDPEGMITDLDEYTVDAFIGFY